MYSKDVPADDVSLTWLAQVCNGINQYRRVHSFFVQTVGNITECINKQIIKIWPAEIYKVMIHATYLKKECRSNEENSAAVPCTVSDSPSEVLPPTTKLSWLTEGGSSLACGATSLIFLYLHRGALYNI
jgi:hypothetical protein